MPDHLIPASLRAALRRVDLPTLGHLMEEGFCGPDIVSMVPTAPRMLGAALPVAVTGSDATQVNAAIEALAPGDVLVIAMTDDHRHAPIGAITRARAMAAGAAGIVVDGPVTDIVALRSPLCLGYPLIPIYARGTTCLTTKIHGAAEGGEQEVVIDGVPVRRGDIVVGDHNGVIISPAQTFAGVIDQALQSDAREPHIIDDLVEKIRRGPAQPMPPRAEW